MIEQLFCSKNGARCPQFCHLGEETGPGRLGNSCRAGIIILIKGKTIDSFNFYAYIIPK